MLRFGYAKGRSGMRHGFQDSQVAGLAPPELLVVAVLRAWMAPRRSPSDQDWQQMLATAGIRPAGVLGFELLMSALARGARRSLDVRHCDGVELGRDEAELLDLVAALQRGDALSAIGGLSEWLAPDNLSAALRGAQIFARHTAAAGLHVRDEGGPTARLLH